MIAAVHAVVGAALGAWLGRPGPAALAGLASHAALDAIPHSDYARTAAGVADALAAAGVAALAARASGWAALAGALGAVVPDAEVALGHLGLWPWAKPCFPSHSGLLPHAQARPPLGIWTQAAAAAAAAVLWLASRGAAAHGPAR